MKSKKMKSNWKRLIENNWQVHSNEVFDIVRFSKYICNKYVTCFFNRKTNNILFFDIENDRFLPEELCSIVDELKKLEVENEKDKNE